MKILISVLFCVCIHSAQAQYSIYFPNNETELIQLERPRQLSLDLANSFEAARIVQLGYSPINHLTIAGGLIYKSSQRSEENRKYRRAFTGAVGTYFLLGKGNVNTNDYGSIPDSVQYNGQWLVTAQLGFSANEMLSAGAVESVGFYISELDYQSVFLTIGLSHKYRYGLFTVTGCYRQLYYKKGVFTGSFFGSSQIEALTEDLKNDNSPGVFSIGVQNRIGMPNKILQLIIGANLPAVYFQSFEKQTASVDRMMLYMGISLDLDKLCQYGKTKLQR